MWRRRRRRRKAMKTLATYDGLSWGPSFEKDDMLSPVRTCRKRTHRLALAHVWHYRKIASESHRRDSNH